MKTKDKIQIKYHSFITAKIERNYWGKQKILVLISRLFVFQMGLKYIGLDWDQMKPTSSGWWLIWDDCPPPQSLKQAIPHSECVSWQAPHHTFHRLVENTQALSGCTEVPFRERRRLKKQGKTNVFSSSHLILLFLFCSLILFMSLLHLFPPQHLVWLLTPHNQIKCGKSSHSPLPS